MTTKAKLRRGEPTRLNPCKGHEAGCTGRLRLGETRCKNCKALHNARERERRKARREACQCRVCGEPAIVVNGVALSTCPVHREYYSERARAAAF